LKEVIEEINILSGVNECHQITVLLYSWHSWKTYQTIRDKTQLLPLYHGKEEEKLGQYINKIQIS
jgi:hypothetical protein